MSSVCGNANDRRLAVLGELNPFVVLGVFLDLYYININIMPFRGPGEKDASPAGVTEKVRAWKEDNRHGAGVRTDLVAMREATGRRVRAIEAIFSVMF